MDSVQLNNNGHYIEDVSNEQSIYPKSPDICDVFGDPEIPPRLGVEYQAEIPPLTTGFESLWYKKSPSGAEIVASDLYDFVVGLPVPIMWINEESKNIKHEGDSNDVSYKNGSNKTECIKETQTQIMGNSKLKVEPSGSTLEDGLRIVESENSNMQQGIRNEKLGEHKAKGHCPAPGSMGEPWSEIEEASFLLGLYIFGKNLVQVKKFIGNKRMQDILSFYYGKFYRSDKYCRWSECRKIRSRRCIYGQRIFTGLRQQEFLSRLLPHLSMEDQNILTEVSKTFGEGKISLEEFVTTLKSIVGIETFIEAVGIGKGKKDLTGMAMEPLKSNQVVSGRLDIPIGKACSSLTPEEIIKFLTGDFRLSKARSSDLFWEAVWPRLLARGWHSEQPKNHNYAAGPKNSLVFLIPSVKKFSRRKLVKGNHYFDSVTDVLSKVASDPELIELDIEADIGNKSKEEYGLNNETKADEDNLSRQTRHCYLQPRTPNRHADLMKFTVVDTSVITSGENFKVRELRSLPFESSNASECGSHSEDECTSEDSTDESNSSGNLFYNQKDYDDSRPTIIPGVKALCSVLKEFEVSSSNGGILVSSSDLGDISVESSKNQKNNGCDDGLPRKATKGQLSRRVKPHALNYIAPVTKRRRRLSACSRAETSRSTISFSVASGFKKEEASCCSGNHDSSENQLCEVDPSEKGSSISSSSKRSPTSEGILSGGGDPVHEKPLLRTLIDLNLPHVSPELDIDRSFTLELTESQDDQTKMQLDKPNGLKTPMDMANTEQQPNISRRQSTRNRPLTTRALEALACGFLSTNRRRKSTEAFPKENLMSKPSRRARGRDMISQVEEGGIDGCKSNGGLLNKFQMEAPISGP
ncbi:uncharacterized protein LOC131152033 isoform X2 [Malania oleifera]|nr:uncharacterized protein LOC131152033 isoform X2 [Malania oleifera]